MRIRKQNCMDGFNGIVGILAPLPPTKEEVSVTAATPATQGRSRERSIRSVPFHPPGSDYVRAARAMEKACGPWASNGKGGGSMQVDISCFSATAHHRIDGARWMSCGLPSLSDPALQVRVFVPLMRQSGTARAEKRKESKKKRDVPFFLFTSM